jgi:hypothetical protein
LIGSQQTDRFFPKRRSFAPSTQCALESLDLSGLAASDDDVGTALHRFPQLTSLNVSECWLLTGQAFAAIARSIQPPAGRRSPAAAAPFAADAFGAALSRVAAAGCGSLTDAAMQALLQAGVRELDASHTGVSQRGLFVIPTAMRAHSLRCVPRSS